MSYDEDESKERDNYDWYSEPFPPAAYPVREAITMSLFAIIVIGGLGWVIWHLS